MIGRRGLSAAVSLIVALQGGALQAEPAVSSPDLSAWSPPWYSSNVSPPSAAVSFTVTEHDAPLWTEPGRVRRGATAVGSRYVVLGTADQGRGCSAPWLLVGAQAWLCAEHGEWSRLPPDLVPRRKLSSVLPYDYYFVGPDGAFGYASLAMAGEGIPDSQLEPGFAVGVERFAEPLGERFAFTSNGLWVAVRDVVPARPSFFHGVHTGDERQALSDFVWVVSERQVAHDAPDGRVSRRLPRLTVLDVTGRETRRGVPWLRTKEGDWVRQQDVRERTVGPLPEGLTDTERWIDVDVNNQLLTAFEGDRAVFATLVSTGRGPVGSATATPLGEFRIWVKLVSTDMTNLEDQMSTRFYAMEAVPWVMFFKGGYGLHGVYWHDAFGSKRSHGCINLSPSDAAFLFEWAKPSLPAGWRAVHPTEFELGTRVRVR